MGPWIWRRHSWVHSSTCLLSDFRTNPTSITSRATVVIFLFLLTHESFYIGHVRRMWKHRMDRITFSKSMAFWLNVWLSMIIVLSLSLSVTTNLLKRIIFVLTGQSESLPSPMWMPFMANRIRCSFDSMECSLSSSLFMQLYIHKSLYINLYATDMLSMFVCACIAISWAKLLFSRPHRLSSPVKNPDILKKRRNYPDPRWAMLFLILKPIGLVTYMLYKLATFLHFMKHRTWCKYIYIAPHDS